MKLYSHLDPRMTDSEMLRACMGQQSSTVRQLSQRLAQRGKQAQEVRQRLESIEPLLTAGALAECLTVIDACRAELDWCFTAPDYPTPKGF